MLHGTNFLQKNTESVGEVVTNRFRRYDNYGFDVYLSLNTVDTQYTIWSNISWMATDDEDYWLCPWMELV